MIVLMAGLPGTGKSLLARELARRTGGHVLNKDVVREALFAPHVIEYSTAQDDLVVKLMLQAAGWLVTQQSARHVFIDGRVFSRAAQVDEVVRFAEEINVPWGILECVCSEETARQRLERDSALEAHPAANRGISLYLEVKQRFEPITREKTVIDTDQPLELCIERALTILGDAFRQT
ncbi:MAG TPA: AAA family ATPase [Terriglobales bacterium]|nr:AAA family ATPase [Terriglobales bacterium]